MAGSKAVDEIVTHILSARSCWSALGISLSARQPTLEDVQKQYRRLALAVHPDKCSHPKSEDAFKALSAFVQQACSAVKNCTVPAAVKPTPSADAAPSGAAPPVHSSRRFTSNAQQNGYFTEDDLGQSYTHLMRNIEEFEASVAADIRLAKERWEAKKMRRTEQKQKQRSLIEATRREFEAQYEALRAVPIDLDAKRSSWSSWTSFDEAKRRRGDSPESLQAPQPAPQPVPMARPHAVCELCQRAFTSPEHLQRHVTFSELHRANASHRPEPET